MQDAWRREHRDDCRRRLHIRHNANSTLEQRTGIVRPCTSLCSYCVVMGRRSRRKVYGTSQRIARLKKPKQVHMPDSLYEFSDFRGLIHADYPEAVEEIESEFGLHNNSISKSEFSSANTNYKEEFPPSIRDAPSHARNKLQGENTKERPKTSCIQ